ncbi:MAG: RDD family protein [Candidatus Hodarchaeales archaeon]
MSKQYQAAPCIDRAVAAIIDSFLNCIPCYFCWKDGIRDGQSIGKGLMGLRVVNYQTGQGGTIGQSCLRNCCDLCWLVLFITEGRRHVGDLIAGTIVIKDQ